MNILHSLVMGVVEGLTEFLPISSTFHLIMTARILSLPSTDFLKLFEVVIQSGAVGALLFLYAKTLLSNKKLLQSVIYSFIPTAVIGLVLYKIIKTVFFEADWLMLSAFVIMGLVFLFLEGYLRQSGQQLTKTCESITPSHALLIGTAQSLSVVPGVSRAGSVIVAMMMLGYKRDESARYTFLLSLPTIFAASALDLFQGRDLLMSQSNNWGILAVGFLTSGIVAYLVMRWFIRYLQSHTLEIFGWYRLIMAGILLLLMA